MMRTVVPAFLNVFLVLFAAFGMLGHTRRLEAASPRIASPRLNVLLILADDQRADTIGALGNPHIQTPHLDQLVASGLSFRRMYMQGSGNPATCVPSRAMLLSGRSLFRIDPTLQSTPTWPAAMGRAGYRTFLTGKWHNNPGVIARDFQTARDVFLGGMSDPMRAPLRQLLGDRLSEPEPAGRHCCERFADAAIDFLKQAPADQPFFCYLPFAAPHDPHIVPEDFPVRYPADAKMLPDNFQPIHPWDNGEMTIRDEKLLPWPRTPEAVQEMNAEYWRYVSYLDHQVGRVLEALQQSPHAENTLVIFTADSGVARGSHGLIGKQNCYEHSLRVPCIVAGPGIPKGASTEALGYLYDLLPTVGALCDVPPPEGSEGIAMDKVLHPPASTGSDPIDRSARDPAAQGRDSLVFGYREDQRAWCDRRWKLIRYPKIDVTQLFDLQEDPTERRDLSGSPEHQPLLRELRERMARELKELGDPVALDGPVARPAKWLPPAG